MNAALPRGGSFGSFTGRPQGLRASMAALRRCFQATWLASNLGFQAKRKMPTSISLSIPRWNRRQGTRPYAVIERPARTWLRALLAPRRLRRRTAEQRRSAVRFRRQIELMDRLVAAAAPIGDEVLAAAVGRVADLHRVDGEQAGRFGFVAGLRQRRRDIADLHQIGLSGGRREVLDPQAVGRVHDMDHAGAWIRRGQPIVEN